MHSCEETAKELKRMFEGGPVKVSEIYAFMHHDASWGPITKYSVCDHRGKPLFCCERCRDEEYFYDTTEDNRELWDINNKIKECEDVEEV